MFFVKKMVFLNLRSVTNHRTANDLFFLYNIINKCRDLLEAFSNNVSQRQLKTIELFGVLEIIYKSELTILISLSNLKKL